jgi:ATP-dependent Clp protease adaptor protein ClpS
MATNTDLALDEDVKLKYPKRYNVLLLNDDYTSMEFVIDILMNIFHKNNELAQQITLDIHQNGKGICGVYSHEIAETKIMQVHKHAKENGFPLRSEMEEE